MSGFIRSTSKNVFDFEVLGRPLEEINKISPPPSEKNISEEIKPQMSVEALALQISEMSNQIKFFQNNAVQQQHTIDRLSRENEARKLESLQLQKANENLQQLVQTHGSKHLKLLQDNSQLDEKLQQINSLVEKLTKENQSLQQRIVELEKTNHLKDQDIEELKNVKKENIELKAQLEKNEKEKFEKAQLLQQMQEERQIIHDSFEMRNADATLFENLLKDKIGEVRNKEQKIEKLEKEQKEWESLILFLRDEINEHVVEKTDLQGRVTSLELVLKERNVDYLLEHNQKLRAEKEHTNRQLKELCENFIAKNPTITRNQVIHLDDPNDLAKRIIIWMKSMTNVLTQSYSRSKDSVEKMTKQLQDAGCLDQQEGYSPIELESALMQLSAKKKQLSEDYHQICALLGLKPEASMNALKKKIENLDRYPAEMRDLKEVNKLLLKFKTLADPQLKTITQLNTLLSSENDHLKAKLSKYE